MEACEVVEHLPVGSTVSGEPVAPLMLLFDTEMPKSADTSEQRHVARIYAKRIVAALSRHLPGVLFDQIFVEMAKHQACDLRVPRATNENQGGS